MSHLNAHPLSLRFNVAEDQAFRSLLSAFLPDPSTLVVVR
jgi:hypothetical protein